MLPPFPPPRAHFTGPVLLEALDMPLGSTRQLYRLLAPLTFYSAALGLTIQAPAGFTSDLTSLPRLAQLYIDNDDPRILRPAIVPHDFLYAHRGIFPPDFRTGPPWPPRPRLSRQQVDQMLIEGMGICGARVDQQVVVYTFVRTLGWRSWGKNTTRAIKLAPFSV